MHNQDKDLLFVMMNDLKYCYDDDFVIDDFCELLMIDDDDWCDEMTTYYYVIVFMTAYK